MVNELPCAWNAEGLFFFLGNKLINVLTLSESLLAQMMLTTFHQTRPGLYWMEMVGHVLNLSNCSHILQGCSPHYSSCNTECP